MTFKNLTINLVLATSVALASGAALAKGSVQTHHCKMTDGTMDMKMTKKACMTAKGTWAKSSGTMPMAASGAMPMSTTKAMMPMSK